MQDSKTPVNNNQFDLNPRSEIIQSYLTTIEDSFRENRPQIKLINYGTGSGKTHQLFQAICKTIENHPDTQIVGIYIAPLREHLKAPDSVMSHYPYIPIYRLNSLEMKMTDEFIKLYKKWIPKILKNKELWNIDTKKCSHEKVREAQQNLSKVSSVISRLEYVRKVDFGDNDLTKYETKKAKQDLNNLIESFLEFVVKFKPDENSWLSECRNLLEIFFPLHVLREKSGILMLTYSKFETFIPYFNHNGKTWIKKNSYLDKYIVQHTKSSKKFILALDEQEDGYQIMLNRKIDIISPRKLAINNALSSINREFSVLFSMKNNENREFLSFIDKNPSAFYEFKEHIEKNKPIDQKLEKLASIYQRLICDEGNSVNFLEQVLKINKGLEQSLEEIVDVASSFDDHDENHPNTLDFNVLSRVFSKFENNRSLLIPEKLYSKISNDLINIFSYNNLYIYNIEPLKKLFLSRSSSGHVQITDQKVSDNASLADLIYTILVVRLQIETIKNFLSNVLDAEDSQSRSLDIWSKQIAKVQKATQECVFQKEGSKYLDRTYVYKSYKSIINIMEICRYQHPKNNLIDHPLREVSIGSTAILTSPEHKINSILANNSNVIFLISATGGISGDLSTSYDMRYLEDNLLNKLGQSSFKTMTEQEILLCEKIREYRQARRKVTIEFFDEDFSSFPNIKTQEVVKRIEKLALKDFLSSYDEKFELGAYKVQELKNFIRFLLYLLENDSIQETIAFTQTLRHIRKLIRHYESGHVQYFTINKSSEHPNIFYVQVTHKTYQGNVRIKVILYEARFDELYYDNKITQKTYLDELVEEEGQKIFFVSAYQSASKGLNPVIKTKGGDEKDFDSLVLLMDSYYTVMSSNFGRLSKFNDSESPITLFHFALMKSIVHIGDSNLEIKDFNEYLSRPEAGLFQAEQHQILLGKTILQTIGRTERRDFNNQVVEIFINEETRKNLVNFYRYLKREDPNEIHKLSINNYQVYLDVQKEENKRTISDYDEHVYDEIDAYFTLQKFRKKMLDEIENFHNNEKSFAVTKIWDALRDLIVFKDPKKYLEKLQKLDLLPLDFIKALPDFIESLFYHNVEQSKFTPHLALVEQDGHKIQIISDSMNGEKIYSYQKRLYPEYLKVYDRNYDLEEKEFLPLNPSTDEICRLYKKLIPHPEIFDSYIPRPDFFYDVLYPSLTENFTECWIQDVIFTGKDWEAIKSIYGFEPLLNFKKYNKLYEKFDLYYTKDNILFCIDVKAWSRSSGNRLSRKTLEKAQNKIDAIISDYSEFSEVRGLILNLYAPQEKIHQHSSTLFSGNLIYLDNYKFPVESTIFKNFLFQKEK